MSPNPKRMKRNVRRSLVVIAVVAFLGAIASEVPVGGGAAGIAGHWGINFLTWGVIYGVVIFVIRFVRWRLGEARDAAGEQGDQLARGQALRAGVGSLGIALGAAWLAVTAIAAFAYSENTASGSRSCTWEDPQPALRTWNRASGELVADYLDPSVSAEAYVQTSRRIMPILDQVVLDLQVTRDCMAPFDQKLFAPLASAYNRKATAMQLLEFAVDTGLLAAEEDALAVLDAANLASNEAMCDLVAAAPGEDWQQLPILSC